LRDTDDQALAEVSAAEGTDEQDDIAEWVLRARWLAKVGSHEEAQRLLTEGLARVPNAPQLLVEQSAQLRRLGKFEATDRVLRTLAVHHPDHRNLPMQRALLAEAMGDPQTAEPFHAADVAANPRDAERRVRWALCLDGLGRANEALGVLAAGLQDAPTSAPLLIQHIALSRRMGQFETAAISLAVLAEHHASHPRLRHLSLKHAEATGDLKTAEKFHAADVVADPQDTGAVLRWADCLERLGRKDEALTAVSAGLEFGPTSPDLLALQCALLRTAGQYEAAEASLALLTEHHPGHKQLPELRRRLAVARGDLDAAEAFYAADVETNPRHIARRLRWTDCLERLGRKDEALAAVSAGLEFTPASADLLVEHIRLSRQMRQFETAAASLAVLAENHPNHPQLQHLRRRLAAVSGDLEALEPFQSADVEKNPDNIALRTRWARSLNRLGRPEEALTALEAGLRNTPHSADLLLQRITVLHGILEFSEAEASLAAMSEYHPGHPRLRQLLGRQAEASGDLDEAIRFMAADAKANPRDAGRREAWARSLRKSGRVDEALAVLAGAASPSVAERGLRIECLLESGRWDAVPALLAEWPDTGDRKDWMVKMRLWLRLTNLRFEHGKALERSLSLRTLAPDDSSVARLVARSAISTFQPEIASEALSRIVAKSSENDGQPRTLPSPFGQIVNDLMLRPAETSELATAARLGDRALVEAAAAQLRRDPRSFGPALGLLIGLARKGGFPASELSGARSRSKIPRTIHQYWHSDTPPKDVERLMAGTKAANADLKYRYWNDAAAMQLLSTLDRSEPLRAYRMARQTAVRADVFRLAVLFVEGGVYLDADDYCASPLHTLLPKDAHFVCYQDEFHSIGSNFLAVTPGHPLIGVALREAAQAIIDGRAETSWLVTGPGLMARVVAGLIAHTPDLRPPTGLTVLPLQVFLRFVHPHRRISRKKGQAMPG